ncbi:MAG: hypothetical protein KTR29_20965 [Rhodothermaceae bacterium]|nr:hypothetical protein [Rhodothermaceae bacterium]
MVLHRLQLASFCIFLLIIGCKTPKVLPPANLLRANHFDKSLQILREGLHSDEFMPSVYAAEAMIDAGYGFEAIPVLREKLKKEGVDVYRARIARALVKGRQQDGVILLQDIILGNDEEAQIESLKGLFYEAYVADTSIVGNVIRSTDNNAIKLYAQGLLHITEKEKHVDEVRAGLTDSDPRSRIAAADIISFIGSIEEDTTQLITNLANVTSDIERFRTLRALALLDHAASRESLPQLTRSPDPSMRAMATYAIAESWLVEHAEAIYPLLEDPSLAVRVRAAQSLLILNDSASLFRYMRLR